MHEIHHNRHLLQPVALLLSFVATSSHAPLLLATPSPADLRALSDAVAAAAPRAARFDRRRKLEAAAAAAKRWAAGGGTNFEYLMALNALAGRTHVDLSQYPVFPWVLADWTSPELDLENPAVFRDLSRPVGALAPERLEAFRERFRSLQVDADAGAGEGAPFLYGTHYSSASIVLWYLLRLEPFTGMARALQARPHLPL